MGTCPPCISLSSGQEARACTYLFLEQQGRQKLTKALQHPRLVGAEAAEVCKPLTGSPLGQRWGSEKDQGGV